MVVIGALVGFVVGVVLYVTTAAFLNVGVLLFGAISSLVTTVLIAPLLALLSTAGWVSVVVFSIGILYLFPYIIATLGVLPGLAALPAVPPPPAAAIPLPPAPVELLFRGFLIGLTAALNFAVWALFPVPGAGLVGVVLAVI